MVLKEVEQMKMECRICGKIHDDGKECPSSLEPLPDFYLGHSIQKVLREERSSKMPEAVVEFIRRRFMRVI